VLELGDEALLSLNLSRAAAHFGVKAPASQRDRKSGAKKRKQIDIERERLEGQAANG
jgi:DNA (cytosine-5)-methyltransferase 1